MKAETRVVETIKIEMSVEDARKLVDEVQRIRGGIAPYPYVNRFVNVVRAIPAHDRVGG